MEYKINLSNTENKDLVSYCNLNDLVISEVIKKSYLEGFNIERYGLLNVGNNQTKVVEKEIIVEKRIEVPVEVVKEVVKVEYVEVEKPVEKVIIQEVIKEVPIEKIVVQEITKEIPVEKIVYVTDEEDVKKKIFQKDLEIDELKQSFNRSIQESEEYFQIEKNKLLLNIKQLEDRKTETVEVIKEVPIFQKSSDSGLQPKLDALQNTVQKLKQDNINKDLKIKEYEKTIEELQNLQQDKRATYLRGSNLDSTLYR